MTPELWREKIKRAVEGIASKDFQSKAWFGKGDEISSPEEVYATLLDDFTFEDFLTNDDINLTDLQKNKGRRLVGVMEGYPPINQPNPNPYFVIDDPEWEKVRKVAQDFLDSLDESTNDRKKIHSQ